MSAPLNAKSLVENFKAAMAGTDTDTATYYLRKHAWDLNRAVEAFVTGDDPDVAAITSGANAPPAPKATTATATAAVAAATSKSGGDRKHAAAANAKL